MLSLRIRLECRTTTLRTHHKSASHVITIYHNGASLFDKYVRSDNCIRQFHTWENKTDIDLLVDNSMRSLHYYIGQLDIKCWSREPAKV